MFTDRVSLHLTAGKGGNGIVAWRREKYIPKGGPSGGNGGRGGDVVIQVEKGLLSLDWFRQKKGLQAENGVQGGSNQQQGRKGKNLVIKVPPGTIVRNADTQELLYDLTEPGQKVVICQGGRGGRGNYGFRTPTNRAPNIATPGKEGETLHVELELKLIADVGLVGFPNAGKSTLISALIDARVKIAPYPFTTLRPNIGYLLKDDYQPLYIADIPGIIEGAHRNRGLGFEFLRHIERTSTLLFVLDASGSDGRDPLNDFRTLRDELEKYQVDLLTKPYLVVLNKIDLEETSSWLEIFYENFPRDQQRFFEISALSGEGLDRLLNFLKQL